MKVNYSFYDEDYDFDVNNKEVTDICVSCIIRDCAGENVTSAERKLLDKTVREIIYRYALFDEFSDIYLAEIKRKFFDDAFDKCKKERKCIK